MRMPSRSESRDVLRRQRAMTRYRLSTSLSASEVYYIIPVACITCQPSTPSQRTCNGFLSPL
jgi:hypothetical protein